MSRREQFERIKEYFADADAELLEKGKLPMRSTERGFWGVSNLDDVFLLLSKQSLDSSTRFLDLGSGDGRVVLVASLFVDAVGVEYDQELVDTAITAADELGLDVEFICDDMRNVDFSSFDVLYSYADQNWSFLAHKLADELSPTAVVWCYHDTYHPRFLEKGRTLWVNQIPIFQYTKPKNNDS